MKKNIYKTINYSKYCACHVPFFIIKKKKLACGLIDITIDVDFILDKALTWFNPLGYVWTRGWI